MMGADISVTLRVPVHDAEADWEGSSWDSGAGVLSEHL